MRGRKIDDSILNIYVLHAGIDKELLYSEYILRTRGIRLIWDIRLIRGNR